MMLGEFAESLGAATMPRELPALLEAVWHGLRGRWNNAHEVAQAQPGPDAAWVHAWLHRIEGDAGNAGYWYRRAGRDPATGDTAAEGHAIAAHLLAR